MGLRKTFLYLHLCMLLNSIQSQNWAHDIILDVDGAYRLSWNPPEDKRSDNKITFKVEVKAKGCFVLGFSPDGGIPGSDIVTGWIKDGEVYFQDRHADASGYLLYDDRQDYEIITAYENDTSTVFEFSRKLDTCDINDMVIDESTMKVIYNYSEEDPADGLDNHSFNLKDDHDFKSILLLQYNPAKEQDLDFDSLLQWDITARDLNISSEETFHWCEIIQPPQISEKHHIVYAKPHIQNGHEELVYHLVFYECIGGTPEEYEDLLFDGGHECYVPDFPKEMFKCQGIIIGWATGGEDISLPEQAGFAIYPGKYYMFEINYGNPKLLSGIIDNSGFRFYYTPNLREFDAGNYVLGASILPRIIIPPGRKEYIVAGHSNPECIQSDFPDSGGKAFAALLHARYLGRMLKIRHFRGKNELSPLTEDKNYDTYYQPFRYFAEEVTVLRDDQLTLECTFDSTEKSTVTLGGWRTTDEICSCILLYYPLSEGYSLSEGYFSYSAPSFANINMVLNTNITKEEDVIPILESYDWSRVDIDKVQDVMRYSELEAQCYVGPFREDEVPTLMSYPNDFIPFEPQSTCNITS